MDTGLVPDDTDATRSAAMPMDTEQSSKAAGLGARLASAELLDPSQQQEAGDQCVPGACPSSLASAAPSHHTISASPSCQSSGACTELAHLEAPAGAAPSGVFAQREQYLIKREAEGELAVVYVENDGTTEHSMWCDCAAILPRPF